MLDGLRILTAAFPALALMMTVACLDGEQARAAEGNRMVRESNQRTRPAVVIADLAYYSDDSVALLMLLRSEIVDILAVITTAGNVCAGSSANDTHRLLQTTGLGPLTVIAGPSLAWHEARRRHYRQIEKPSWTRAAYAGALEMDQECKATRGSTRSDTSAAEFLVDAARKHPGELVVVLQGPATVLAQALNAEPELPRLLHRVYAMGGSLNVPGNVTQAAEFNVWFDPEAMSALVGSGAVMTLVPLDATEGVTFSDIPHATLKGGGPVAEFVGDYIEFRRSRSGKALMWDEVLAAVVIDPSIVQQSQRQLLMVSKRKDPSYGRLSIATGAASGGQRSVDVVTKVDAARVRAMVTNLLAGR